MTNTLNTTNTATEKPIVKIIATDYIDGCPTDVYTGHATVNGLSVYFDVCNGFCDNLEICNDPELNPVLSPADMEMIDEHWDYIHLAILNEVTAMYNINFEQDIANLDFPQGT